MKVRRIFFYGFSCSGNWDPEVEHMNLAHILSLKHAQFRTDTNYYDTQLYMQNLSGHYWCRYHIGGDATTKLGYLRFIKMAQCV